jgi:hypothetical protein
LTRPFLYSLCLDDVVWREWEGVYAVFNCKDETTHFIDPISSAVLDRLKASGGSLPFDNLVSFVLDECGGDVDADRVADLLEERLPQLQQIGIVRAFTKP